MGKLPFQPPAPAWPSDPERPPGGAPGRHDNRFTAPAASPPVQRILRASVKAEELKILEEYTVVGGLVSVTITGDGRYLVNEPEFSEAAEAAYARIMGKMRESHLMDIRGRPPAEVERMVYDGFWEAGLTMYGKREMEGLFPTLRYYIARDITGYGILHPLMTDPEIEDVQVSAPARPVHITHKRHSNRFTQLITNIAFPGDDEMKTFILRMFLPTGNEPTVIKPGAVTYLPDKSRISVTLGSVVSEPGSTISIRKFPEKPYVITHMMRGNTLTPRMAAFLWSLLDAQGAGLVIGTTGSGKTTLLAALTTMMNPRWRVLTIEDALELQIPHLDWVRYHTRKTTSTVGAEHDVTISRLINQSLTQRPNYEIIGEIRDVADAKSLFQSMGTGHGGLCLPPGEMLPVRCGQVISYDAIRNVIERFRDGEELQAYSMSGGRCGWHPITGTIVKRGPDDWRRITACGATATVHAGHPMITERGVVAASDIMPGDSVPVVLGLQREAAAYLGSGDGGGRTLLDAANGRLMAAQHGAELRHFALSGPEEFVRECGGVIPERYHPISGLYAWEKIESVERPSLGTRLYDIEVRSAHNFAHGGGVCSHNTTFHANSPRAAMTRMELGGVGPEDMALLSFVIYITEVRLGGVKKRRVRSITEVTPDAGGQPKLRDLFTYSPKSDSFHEVPDLLQTEQYGGACFRNSVEDPEADMKRREKLLRECITAEANDIGSVFSILGRYYAER